MSEEICKICNGTHLIRENNKWVECQCMVRERIKNYLSEFIPAPRPTSLIRNLSKTLLNIKRESFKIFIPFLSNDQYRTLFSYYLLESGRMKDFFLITSYRLIDLYLRNIEDSDIYTINQNLIIILYGFSDIGNKQEINIINQFVDVHKQKDVIIYSNKRDSQELKMSLLSKGFKNFF